MRACCSRAPLQPPPLRAQVLGGPDCTGANSYFARKFCDIGSAGPHTHVEVEWTFVAIDSWDRGDTYQVLIDHVQVFSGGGPKSPLSYETRSAAKFKGETHLCGVSGRTDMRETTKVIIPHTSDCLHFTLSGKTNSGSYDESWGLQKVTITALHM